MSKECVLYQRSVSTTDDFTISPSVTVYGVCPSGFSVLHRRCIKIVTDRLNWNAAKELCRGHGAELITLESQAKMSTFRDLMLADGYGSYNDYFWCGASEVNGVWQWIDGETFSSNSDLWCDNQPGGANEHCTMIRKETFNCFHDELCDSNHPFVCEIEI
ncbi:C-type lectin domain family 6 member A-like [Haliotis asinina]|uniref:C-type lectin domain family 6 member A-like n=1 Tax=Haliotis asinina TaxID=109174 RepID=UPI003531D521